MLAVIWWAWVVLRVADERRGARRRRGPDRDAGRHGRAARRRDLRPGGVRRPRPELCHRLWLRQAGSHLAVRDRKPRPPHNCGARCSTSRSARRSRSRFSSARRSSTGASRRRCGWRRSCSTGVAQRSSASTEWRLLVPAHFAERHNLVIILALGESVIALGAGAELDLTAAVTVAAVLGIGLAAALWWIYFDVVALVTERRLTQAPEGAQRNKLARDSYSYLHFPMVAGIVLGAFGLDETLAHVDEPLDGQSRVRAARRDGDLSPGSRRAAAPQRAHGQHRAPRARPGVLRPDPGRDRTSTRSSRSSQSTCCYGR